MTIFKVCDHDLPEGFCHACLRDFPPDIMSPDPRYCHECYDLLTEEAKFIGNKARPDWLPVSHASRKHTTGQKSSVKGVPNHLGYGEVLQRTNKTSPNNGGRPRKEVPLERIKELSKSMGVRDIARELNIHHSMVSRILSGKR